jgi:hypothetical protein
MDRFDSTLPGKILWELASLVFLPFKLAFTFFTGLSRCDYFKLCFFWPLMAYLMYEASGFFGIIKVASWYHNVFDSTAKTLFLAVFKKGPFAVIHARYTACDSFWGSSAHKLFLCCVGAIKES